MGSNPTSDKFTFLKLHLFVFVFVVVIVFVVVVVLLKSGKIVRRIKESKKTSFVVTQAKRSSVKLSFHEDIRYSAYPCHSKYNVYAVTLVSGWPSGLRRCVQVAVYFCRRGFESHF